MIKKITPKFHAERKCWMLDLPASRTASGKRTKMFFKSRDEARIHLDEINGEMPAATIPTALAAEADKARSILEPYGLDIVQAAREVAAALEALGDAGSILEAATAYRANFEARTSSVPLGVAVARYLDSKTDLRNTTLNSYRYTLERMLVSLHLEKCADITTAQIEALLAPKAPTSRAMHKRSIRVFWKWASASPRAWAKMEAVDALEAIRISNDADIEILKPAEVKALLHAAELEGAGAAAAYALAIFAGVRMTELTKLTWGAIGDDYIEIGKSIAKKHSRRLIPICPTLRAWIDATRGDAEDGRLICPPNWVDVSKSVRRRAGWDVAARLLVDPPKPTRGEWPTNACRHTCASTQVAIGTPLDDLTFKFGHSGGHDLLRKHYVSRLTKKDALAILSTGPNGSKVSNIAVA